MYVSNMQILFVSFDATMGKKTPYINNTPQKKGIKRKSENQKRKLERSIFVAQSSRELPLVAANRTPVQNKDKQSSYQPYENYIRHKSLQNMQLALLHRQAKGDRHTVIGSSAERVWACLYLVLYCTRSTFDQ